MSNKEAAKPKASLGLAAALRAGSAAEQMNVEARLDAAGVGKSADGGEPASGPAGAPAYGGRTNTVLPNHPQRLRLDQLVSNPFGPRIFYSPEAIDDLAVKLQRETQRVAIIVTTNPRFPGKYVIVDGECRTRAKRSLGDEFINADVVAELSDQDLYLIANSVNKNRNEQTVFDDVLAWNKVLNEGVFSTKSELAEKLGEDLGKVSKTLSLNVLPMHMLQRMSDAKLGLAHAYNLKLIFERQGAVYAEEVLDRVIAGEYPVRKLEDIVRRVQGDAPARAAKTHYSGKVPFQTSGGRDVGSLRRYQDGRTELKLTGLTEEQQAILAPQIEEVVRKFVSTHLLEDVPPTEGQS